MTPEQWAKAKSLFELAMETPQERRASLVHDASGGDRELETEVLRLLRAHGAAGDFMQQAAADLHGVLRAGDMSTLGPGSVLAGRFEVLRFLNAGGMGEVYEAFDRQLNEAVAVKIISPRIAAAPGVIERFKQEVRHAREVSHPNICRVHELFCDEGGCGSPTWFLSMELLNGPTLLEAVRSQGPLPPAEGEAIAAQLCAGLEAAHARGLAHRDFKSGNVMLAGGDQRPAARAVITDFGLSLRVAEGGFADVTAGVGTPGYMSPEQQTLGQSGPLADQYAFGAVLSEISTGWLPVTAKDTRQAHRSAAKNGYPSRWDAVIQRCTEAEPEQRFADMAAVRQALLPSAWTKHRTAWLATAAALLVALAAVGVWKTRHDVHAATLTEKDVVVLADFENSTGQPVFDGTLRQGLSVQLEQSPFLSILPDDRVQQTLALMGRPTDTKLVPAVAREVCQRTGSTAVLDGSISRIGTQYLLTLKAVNCESGITLTSTEAQAANENHVLEALGGVSVKMRGELGESLSTIQKFDTPLEQATTPSLEALKAYSSGIKVTGSKAPEAAIPFFKRAIELDPNFAAAYAYLGILATDIQQPTLSVAYRTKAYELRDHTSAAERYWVSATYFKGVNGDISKAVEACDLWIAAYPRSYFPHLYLSSAILPVVGNYERAAQEVDEALRLRPDYPYSYGARLEVLTALGRFDDATAAYKEAGEHNVRDYASDFYRYYLAFLQNDTAEMARDTATLERSPHWSRNVLFMQGETAAYAGHLKEAREFTRRAADSTQGKEDKDSLALYLDVAAIREALFGNLVEAQRQATAALKVSSERDALAYAGVALAYAGDSSRAKTIAEELNRRFPEDTLVQFNYLPSIRGKLALNKREAPEAIQLLEAAIPYELGETRANAFLANPLFPVFVRGEAYLATHDGSKAAIEFQKILDHRGIVLNRPIGALAHLGLGRAYVLQGDIAKAKSAYEDFLKLWEHADPDVPMLKQARAEYTRLQQDTVIAKQAARRTLGAKRRQDIPEVPSHVGPVARGHKPSGDHAVAASRAGR